MAVMNSHMMRSCYWPRAWQRVFQRIELITYVHTCEEKYVACTHDNCVVEFESMDALDAYARAVYRIDEANNNGWPPYARPGSGIL